MVSSFSYTSSSLEFAVASCAATNINPVVFVIAKSPCGDRTLLKSRVDTTNRSVSDAQVFKSEIPEVRYQASKSPV